ncbi:hypothetical protein RJT34_23750 [Clitoria ternatea]|uniref:Uncharacterized protein n=1 Tax=Clitoria ternatea TaxID=43366 RepID=A0AAN9FLT7_CLITE
MAQVKVHCNSTGTIHQRSSDGLSQEYHVEDSRATEIVGKKLFSTPSPVYSRKRNRDLDGADMTSHDSIEVLIKHGQTRLRWSQLMTIRPRQYLNLEIIAVLVEQMTYSEKQKEDIKVWWLPPQFVVNVEMGKSTDEVFEKYTDYWFSPTSDLQYCDILSTILAREEYLDYIELHQPDLNSWAYSDIFGIPTNVNRMKLAMELVNNQFNQFADLIRNNAEQGNSSKDCRLASIVFFREPPPAKLSVSSFHPSGVTCEVVPWVTVTNSNWQRTRLPPHTPQPEPTSERISSAYTAQMLTQVYEVVQEGHEKLLQEFKGIDAHITEATRKLEAITLTKESDDDIGTYRPIFETETHNTDQPSNDNMQHCILPDDEMNEFIHGRLCESQQSMTRRCGGDMQTQSHSAKGKGKQPMSDEAVKNNQLHPPLHTTTLTLGKRLTEGRKSATSKPNKIIKSMAAKVTWNQQSIKDPSVWCLPPSFVDSIEDAETLNITVEYGEQSNLGWRSLFLNAAFAVLHNHMSLDCLTWLRCAFMDMFTMFFIQLVIIGGALDIVVS